MRRRCQPTLGNWLVGERITSFSRSPVPRPWLGDPPSETTSLKRNSTASLKPGRTASDSGNTEASAGGVVSGGPPGGAWMLAQAARRTAIGGSRREQAGAGGSRREAGLRRAPASALSVLPANPLPPAPAR